jgi:hypothetical protein
MQLEKCVSDFSRFYNEHHNGRKLTWLWHLSKGTYSWMSHAIWQRILVLTHLLIADVKLTYLDKYYEFSVSLYQLCVLLLFNSRKSILFREIREHTSLGEAELGRVLKVCFFDAFHRYCTSCQHVILKFFRLSCLATDRSVSISFANARSNEWWDWSGAKP